MTLGLLSIRKVDTMSALAYLAAQFVGALVALGVGRLLFPAPAEVIAGGAFSIGMAELLGAVIFLFAIGSVVAGRVSRAASGLVIGTGLLLGIAFAAQGSNGVLNPAVALGIGSFSHPYVWGPIVGAAIGAWLAHALSEPGGGEAA